MNFTTLENFENYVKDKGFEVAEQYPQSFSADLRDYKIDMLFDEEDESFDYSFFINIEIEIPSAFFTEKTGNKSSFKLKLIKI